MAQAARSNKLETRNARMRLPLGKRFTASITKDAALIYRRTKGGYGTWAVRERSGKVYKQTTLGAADDTAEADNAKVFTYFQAQELARKLIATARRGPGDSGKLATVDEAAADYVRWMLQNRKSGKEAHGSIKVHILPTFGGRALATLTKHEIERWHGTLATKPRRKRTGKGRRQQHAEIVQTPEAQRARRATANRVLTTFKALLNRAYENGLVDSNAAWSKVKAFRGTDAKRIRFLTEAECTRLVNACDPEFRPMIEAALQTGARYGELVRMTVGDVMIREDMAVVHIAPGKTGKGRSVPLSPAGRALFAKLIAGWNDMAASLLTKADGKAWGSSQQGRRMAEACRNGGVVPKAVFHELRHTYASALVTAGVNLYYVAQLIGDSLKTTEKHYAHLRQDTLAAAVAMLPTMGASGETEKVKAIR